MVGLRVEAMRPRAENDARPIRAAVCPWVRVNATPRARLSVEPTAKSWATAFFSVFIFWTGCRPVRFFVSDAVRRGAGLWRPAVFKYAEN